MKHLKKFETAEAYNAATLDLPNVSLIEETMSVGFNPYVEPETKLVCKYNVTDTSNPTVLRLNYEQNIFKSMEIDDVMLDELVTEYTFNTTGEHTVKYELYDETKLGNSVPMFYNSNLINCIIPDSVTSIGYNAFNGCSGLTSIVIPDSVTSIGNSAFHSCSSLTSVTIGSGVTTIGSSAFIGCSGLTSIIIPDSVTSIENNAFSNCNGLISIKVESGNNVYDSRDNCNAIIKTSSNTLIQGCKTTVIPGDVTSIGNSAFTNCSSLTSVIIPDSVTSIGDYAFNGCSNLTSIVSNAMTAPIIQSGTFEGVKTGGILTVPSGSTGYDAWMSTDNYYLGKYNWTKVEQ